MGLWHSSWSDVVGRSYLLPEVIYLFQRSLVSVYVRRSAASWVSWRILGVKYSIGEGFQLCQFWTSVVTYAPRSWLPGISLLDLLLTVPDKVLHSEVQDRFSLMSLPIDKTSWLKIIERLPRKMLGARGLHLLMTALGVVHESLAILCMPACRRVESSIASEIHL